MKIFPTRIRDLSFWHYQIIGWLLFYAFRMAIAVGAHGFAWMLFLNLSAQLVLIFLLLLALRQYYHRLSLQSISLVPLIVRIVAASFITTVVSFCIWYGIEFILHTDKVKGLTTPLLVITRLSFIFPIFLGWSGLYFGIKAWRDWLDEQDNTREAMESAQRAQLQMLRYQLNPHFLFNVLNSVRALIDEDTRGARTMITELSEFLRYSLTSRNKPVVTLRDEVDAVKLYLSVEQRRYEDKLNIEYDIDPPTEDIAVPSVLIYPLIEQAIKCGMQTSSMPLQIRLQSRIIDEHLRITVSHSGCPVPTNGSGMLESGIEQVEARLKELFPENYHITVLHTDGRVETVIEIAITRRTVYEEKTAGNYN